MTGQRALRRVLALAVVVAAAVAGTTLAVGSTTAPAAAAPGAGCPGGWIDANGNCHITIGDGRPGGQVTSTTRAGGGGPSDDGPGQPNPYICEWHQYPNPEHWRTVFPEAPPDAIFGEYRCFLDGAPIYGPYVPRWLAPGSPLAPPPPSPEQVAAAVWVEVEGLLQRPTVATDPPLGERATVEVPTFVEVTNWQGPISRSRCELGVCVELTATPTLVFDPGERGAEPVECTPPGTRYDPDGPEPDEQAAVEGACAHVYRLRTGVAGRPDEWPGEVRISWEVAWRTLGAPGGGTSGTLPTATLSTDVPRAVREAPTVVVSGGRGGGG
jgi:hypothetical protein